MVVGEEVLISFALVAGLMQSDEGRRCVEEVEGQMQEEQGVAGAVRLSGVDRAALDARLAECEAFFLKHVDELDYRNLDWYLSRASLNFARGEAMGEVADDLFMAARCLHNRHTLHLELRPIEFFLTRRVLPVELGLISGTPLLTLELSATYGMPLMMLMAREAPDDVFREANLLTSYFRRGSCANHFELAGLGAVVYAGVLAAIGRGFDDEAILGLNAYAEARAPLQRMPAGGAERKVRRYDQLCLGLACLLRGEYAELGQILEQVVKDYEQDLRAKTGEVDYFAPSQGPAPRYLDTATVALLAAVALRGQEVPLGEAAEMAGYREMMQVFLTVPEREIEGPELDAEARQLLTQMGMDPDQLTQSMRQQAEQSQMALAEARAEAELAERQRAAEAAIQRRIRERLAAGPVATEDEGGRPAWRDTQEKLAMVAEEEGHDLSPCGSEEEEVSADGDEVQAGSPLGAAAVVEGGEGEEVKG